MKSWENLRVRNPIRHKAYRIKMSLRTMKVKDAWTLDEVYDKICRPIVCPYCEVTVQFESLSLDHIIARSEGGADHISNIQFTCLRCNMLKGKLNDSEFRRLLVIMRQCPELITIYEKRISPSLKYWERCISKKRKYNYVCVK